MSFITIRDLRMYYELRGTGPRLLGISGTGGDLRRFPTVFELLPAQDFEILAYDQRGLGRTSCPDIPYTMADYADDADALLEALGKQIPGSRLELFEGGHLFFIQDPRAVERIGAFLRGEIED
jgi:pimeloyl-ACP methyl ester carboxylesterase